MTIVLSRSRIVVSLACLVAGAVLALRTATATPTPIFTADAGVCRLGNLPVRFGARAPTVPECTVLEEERRSGKRSMAADAPPPQLGFRWSLRCYVTAKDVDCVRPRVEES